jgi:tRNA(Ile)-lysidine synthase
MRSIGNRRLTGLLYHPLVRPSLSLDTTLLRPGLRLAVALSGGADSVALLCTLAERSRELGLVLHAAHLHHGLRGDEADADLAFAQQLAAKLNIPFHHAQVDTAAEAQAHGESIEEAARRLRYSWFRQLMSKGLPHAGALHAVATAHTLDDQAETVLAKFLRGAWTEGLSGIHPVLEFPEGRILRPLLAVTRPEIEAYLRALGQPWREDSSNRLLTFTRNRIRHELLPLLETWNPRLREHLAHSAELAHDEEAWWQTELARLAPQIILPGRPVRGGGRATADGLAIDVTRLAALHPAQQRRLLRHAAKQTGAALDFPATESLRTLALNGRAGQKLELAQGMRAERSHRELRLTAQPPRSLGSDGTKVAPAYAAAIPGEVDAPAFGIRLRIDAPVDSKASTPSAKTALLRSWKPGDRVRVKHSSGPRKVKEVLERMKVTGSDRGVWPVLEIDGRIAWMRGIELEPDSGIEVVILPLAPETNISEDRDPAAPDD